MSIPVLPISSPDITALSYKILFDISGALPSIVLTNLSTVVNPTELTWWYVITTPSGIPIHNGSVTSPDVSEVAWTTLTLPQYAWTTPFGTPPCGQVEFSPNSPYVCTLYVKDSVGNTYSLAIQQTITRPNGNTKASCGNFGVANVSIEVKCNDKAIFCADSSNVAYNNVSTPTAKTSEWILSYPPDAIGNDPDNATASNTPTVLFNAPYSGDGYIVYLNVFCTYDMGNGASVKMQYKAINPKTGSAGIQFAVLCNINLCKLSCQIQEFYKLSKRSCGQLEIAGLTATMTQMNLLLNQAIIGVLFPLCGIDVPAIIKQIQAQGKLDDNCDCGCGDTGMNFSYPQNRSLPSGGGCCPTSTNVIDVNTDTAPANCPTSYFPAIVKDPTGTIDIGTAYDVNGLVGILNAYPAWAAYGVAFPQGNCKIGWFPANSGTTIPDVGVELIEDVNGGGGQDGDGSGSGVNFQVNIYLRGTTQAPPPCPGSFYPANVWNYANTAILGVANTPVDLVSILNADPTWSSYATYTVLSNCAVGSNVKDPNNLPTQIKVTLIPVIDTGYTVDKKIIDVGTSSPPVLCPASFYPAKVYDPTGTSIIGIVNNITDMVSLLNGTPAWAAYGTASPVDNCNVRWIVTNPNNIPPDILVDTNTTGTGCVGNSTIYNLVITDLCVSTAAIMPSNFPINAYIDFGLGGGNVNLGVVADMAALIVAYNTTPTKPASLTFSAGSPFGTIIVFNSSCTAFSGTITISADLGSTDFLFYGGNHKQMTLSPPSTAQIQALGVKNSTLIGKIAGTPPSGVDPAGSGVWHSIKIGKYLLETLPYEQVNQIRIYDITDPLMPVFYRYINLLDTGSGACFTGVPQTKTVSSPSVNVPTAFGMYFVTDNPEQMPAHQVYVVESVTGSIWKLDINDIGTGVLDSFADAKLLGKCPRVIKDNKIYFTQDGDLEQQGPLVSGVAKGFIPVLDLTDFSGTGISIIPIYEGVVISEYIWAATYDGLDTIWFITREGTLVKFSLLANLAINSYTNAFATATYRLNAKFYQGAIYASCLQFVAKTTGTQVLNIASLPTITRIDFQNFTPPGSVVTNNNCHYNTLPLQNCLVAVTYNNYADSAHPQGGVAIFGTNGTFIKVIQLAGGNIYNLVPFKPFIPPYTPTTLVP